MTITLDVTVSGLTSNSYISIANADTYVETYILQESIREQWNELSDDDKARYLIHATKLIDENFDFQGWKAIYNQRLLWPRYDAWLYEYNLPISEIPELVKNATAEFAVYIMQQGSEESEQDISAFKKIAVGSISVEFSPGASTANQLIPDKVIGILEPLGSYQTTKGNVIHQVRLERS